MNTPLRLRPSPSHSRLAFSLVELLVAVAIISLLVSLSVPALTGFTRSRGLTNGGNLVVALAQQARQNASTKNSLTALVLTPGTMQAALCLTELAPGADQWTTVVPWQLLPKGVAIDARHSATFIDSPGISPAPAAPRFQGTAAPGVAYQIFSPDGGLYVGSNGQPADPPVLRLAFVPERAQGDYYEISFNLLTGTPKIVRP